MTSRPSTRAWKVNWWSLSPISSHEEGWWEGREDWTHRSGGVCCANDLVLDSPPWYCGVLDWGMLHCSNKWDLPFSMLRGVSEII